MLHSVVIYTKAIYITQLEVVKSSDILNGKSACLRVICQISEALTRYFHWKQVIQQVCRNRYQTYVEWILNITYEALLIDTLTVWFQRNWTISQSALHFPIRMLHIFLGKSDLELVFGAYLWTKDYFPDMKTFVVFEVGEFN